MMNNIKSYNFSRLHGYKAVMPLIWAFCVLAVFALQGCGQKLPLKNAPDQATDYIEDTHAY